MTSKAYIVANEQQEMAVLRELEGQGSKWLDEFDKPTEFIPSIEFGSDMMEFPYVIFTEIEFNFGTTIYIEYDYLKGFDFSNTEIAFDGRKELKMSDKYVVSQEFINELMEWKNNLVAYDEPGYFIDDETIKLFPYVVTAWWVDNKVPDKENNNRLIAIIRWVNGEDVFEVENPNKWVVRSKETDNKGNYMYGYIVPNERLKYMEMAYGKYPSAYFDTKEEAESWANGHQEVVEVKA